MRRSVAWSTKGERASVSVPRTRSITMTILGAISAHGPLLFEVKVRQPSMNKKRKKDRGHETTQLAPNNKYGTNSSHYFSYIKHLIKEMDRHSVYKEALHSHGQQSHP